MADQPKEVPKTATAPAAESAPVKQTVVAPTSPAATPAPEKPEDPKIPPAAPEVLTPSRTLGETTSGDASPYTSRIRALRKEYKSIEGAADKHSQMRREMIKAQLEDLRESERRRANVADPRGARGSMLDRALDAARLKNPDLHVRLVNTGVSGRKDYIESLGYRVIPEGDGGAKVGELVTYGIPREEYGVRETVKRQRTAAGIAGYKKEMKAAVERVVEEINSERGTHYTPKDILIDNSSED